MSKIFLNRSRFSWRFAGAFVLSLMLTATAAHAADADADGLNDALEASTGITLIDNTLYPMCGPTDSNVAPCVHPGSPDLFVAIVRVATGSLMPSEPLAVLGGLNRSISQITGIHELTPGQIDTVRLFSLSTAQKAVRVTESLALVRTSDGSLIWGKTPVLGTPNTAGESIVYTQAIANDVRAKYNAAIAAGGQYTEAVIQAKIAECVRHVTAHEVGHTLGPLAAQYNAKLGGNHYSTTQRLTMSQAPTLSQKSTSVTAVCPSAFTSADATTFRIN